MRIQNELPLLLSCLRSWKNPPTAKQFREQYFEPLKSWVGVVFDDDSESFHSAIEDLDWLVYRDETLRLDPAREEARLRLQMKKVEELFGIALEGEVVLFGAFACMDGYARFDRGRHRVFMGVDESHGRGAYLDVLTSHELTHVIRESRHTVWQDFGLDPMMTHDQFTENLPVIEHLFGEGFSCTISEILNPGEAQWHYAYQEEETLARVLKHGADLDSGIRAELRKGPDGDYGKLYGSSLYGRKMPAFSHYVWAWQWTKHLLRDWAQGDPRKIVDVCSQEFLEDALRFELRGLLT